MKKRLMTWGLAVSAALTLASVFPQNAAAQNRFQSVVGDANVQQGRALQQLSDGGYIVAGYTARAGTGDDVYLVRFNSVGARVWSFAFDIGGNDYGYYVDVASDGGFVITGKTENSNGCTQDDIFLLKTDANGNHLWTRIFGGSGEEEGTCIQRTTDNGFIVSGRTNSVGDGNMDGFLLKTDASGNLTWWQTYGGTAADFLQSVHQTSDGGYIAAGGTDSYNNGTQAFVVRTNGSGAVQWAREYGGANQDFIWSVRQTADGGYITVGLERSYTGTPDMFLVKLTAAGAVNWAKTYGFSFSWDEAISVKECIDQSLIICGYTQGENQPGFGSVNAYMLKTNFSGSKTWSRIYGGNSGDIGWNVIQTADGGFACAGRTASFGAGSDDVYLIKTEQNGVTPCNNIDVVELTSIPTVVANSISPHVYRTNMAFTASPARNTLGTGTVLCFANTPLGLLYREDPAGAPGLNAEDAVENNAAMFKSTVSAQGGEVMKLYPNPVQADASFVVEYAADPTAGDVSISVSDMLGRTVYRNTYSKVENNTVEVTTAGWATGMYMVTVQTMTGTKVIPVVIR